MQQKCEPKYSASWITSLPPSIREQWILNLPPRMLYFLQADWEFWAMPNQLPPVADWYCWLIMGGRGAGKTRAGAEWIKSQVASGKARRIALVGETYADAREVMVSGVSGIINIHSDDFKPHYESSRRRVIWPNGAVAQIFSSEDPDGLRGPQFDAAWCDEIGKWRLDIDTWDMLSFALRLGDNPQICATTTPRNTPLIKRLINQKSTQTIRIPTTQNAQNLSPGFINNLKDQLGNSQLTRQELDGELIIDDPKALWQRKWIDDNRVKELPELVRVVIGVDPCVSSSKSADSCGIIVVGMNAQKQAFVIADKTMHSVQPSVWSNEVQKAINNFEADSVVAEINQGGEIISWLLRNSGVQIPIIPVRAKKSKAARAAPIAVHYELGRVSHVGLLADLEDQLCTWKLGDTKSPDRLDALVWALDYLFNSMESGPRMRQI